MLEMLVLLSFRGIFGRRRRRKAGFPGGLWTRRMILVLREYGRPMHERCSPVELFAARPSPGSPSLIPIVQPVSLSEDLYSSAKRAVR